MCSREAAFCSDVNDTQLNASVSSAVLVHYEFQLSLQWDDALPQLFRAVEFTPSNNLTEPQIVFWASNYTPFQKIPSVVGCSLKHKVMTIFSMSFLPRASII